MIDSHENITRFVLLTIHIGYFSLSLSHTHTHTHHSLNDSQSKAKETNLKRIFNFKTWNYHFNMQIIARSIKRFFFLKKMLREFIFFIFLPIVPRSLFTYEYIFYDKFNFLFSHLQKTTIFTDIGILRRVGKHFSFLACFPSTLLKQSPCSLSLCPSGRFPDARI